MKIAGVVILYYPDDYVISRIHSYLNHIDRLYVIDNSDNTLFTQQSFANEKVKFIHDKENKGISARLNQAATLALQEKFSWLLTMDQDSYFSPEAILQYFNCIEQYPTRERTAMFGVQFLEKTSSTTACLPVMVPHLITSGSVLNLELFSTIGKFDEALFIDKVDHEYCLRARLKNFDIIQFDNIFLYHNLGIVSLHRSLKNFNLTPRVLHSPIRMYYILRNYLYLRSLYKGQFKDSFKEMKQELFNRIKNNLLYGNNKFQLIRYLLKGYSDYSTGKMGKFK